MRGQAWDSGRLYSRETDELPQRDFSHEFGTGDPDVLAAAVRKGLARVNSRQRGAEALGGKRPPDSPKPQRAPEAQPPHSLKCIDRADPATSRSSARLSWRAS